MRILLSAAAAIAFCFAAGASNAADLPVPRHQMTTMPKKAQPKTLAACLKWVPENYSWYNYCDPVPNYGKHQNHWNPAPF